MIYLSGISTLFSQKMSINKETVIFKKHKNKNSEKSRVSKSAKKSRHKLRYYFVPFLA